MREWGNVLAGLSGDDIKRGLNNLLTDWPPKDREDWPPTAYEFRELCKPPINPHDGTDERLPKPLIDRECGRPFMDKMRDKLK